MAIYPKSGKHIEYFKRTIAPTIILRFFRSLGPSVQTHVFGTQHKHTLLMPAIPPSWHRDSIVACLLNSISSSPYCGRGPDE